ncbi:MAG TPA: phage major capsid protein [Anaerolineae bacterium]|nr:phage major capsid protein [Anaerolineae bacterium]
MSAELKETIQALGKAFDVFKAENDARLKEIEKKGAADPLLSEKVDKINADIAQISALKKQLETLETAVAQGQFPGGGKNELDRVKAQHKDAFAKFFRKGAEGGLRDLEVQAGLSTLSDPDGGFLVPEDYEQAIDRVALSVSAMRRLATVRTIGTDTYKKLVNKGGASSGWVGEKGARAETNTPTLVEIAINAKELYAMPAATQTLLDDSRVDIAGWLADEVSIEFSEQESEAFINGNGVEQPKGIAAYTMVANASYAWGKVGYITSGNASLINDLDKLIDLQHALKPVYRNGAAWLMNDATLATIRKMKDGDGNYIWVPGLKDGAPDTLLGKPVEIDDNVDDIGAGKYPIFFANFKRAYLIIDRQGVRVLRDPYTSKPYVLFYTTRRVGGGIVMYEAIKALKVSA